MHNYFEHLPPPWVETLSDALQQKINLLQTWLKEKLFTLGNEGFNNHLMGCARSLGQHFNREELREILTACGDAYTRPVEEREINKVIAKAYDDSPPGNSEKWPDYDPELVAEIYKTSEVKSIADLTQKFGVEETETKAILKGLFPDDPLVCFGEDPYKFSTKKLSEHLIGNISKMPFIGPSPMSKLTGLTKEGNESAHCLDNTGPRTYLVIEFDKRTKEAQAACISHLGTIAPLVQVVNSGNKSLHAWFDCRDQSEKDLYRFMAYAVRLGADPAMFTKSQFARTPGAIRDNGNKQSVVAYRQFEAYYEEWYIEKVPKIYQPEKSREDFELIHISEIELSTESIDFVEGLLLRGDVSVILATPGAGKSFFALDIASSVAMGRKWRDRETERGAVIYVCLEGVTGFKRRIHAFKKEGLFSDDCPFYLLEVPLNLLNPEHGQKLIESINKKIQEIEESVLWIVIDTLSRSMPGGNENAVEDMTRMLTTVQTIQAETGAHVSLVHHTGKDESRGARGHSSLIGAIGTEITLSWDEDSKISTAKVTKQKDLECVGKFRFKLRVVHLCYDDKDREITSCVVEHLDESEAPQKKKGRPSKYEPEELLELLPVETMGEWQKTADDELGMSRSSFNRLKKKLVEGEHYKTDEKTGEFLKYEDFGKTPPNETDPLS